MDICECPKCGRQHRSLGFGKPPQPNNDSLLARMEAYASRFDRAEKPQHGQVIRGWISEIKGVGSKTALDNSDDAQTERVARAICRCAHPDYTPTQIDHAWTAYKDHALDAIAALHGGSGKPRKINTHHNPKPMPARGFDWSATFDDYEPGAPIGYGATKEAAIADLHREAAESQVGS